MSAFDRLLRRHGETWTLNGWASSTRDEYEDELAVEPTGAVFSAIRSSPKEEVVRDEKGRTRWEALDLLVAVSLTLPSQTRDNQPVTLTSPEGRIYDLIGVGKAGAPVGAKRLRLKTGGGDASLYL